MNGEIVDSNAWDAFIVAGRNNDWSAVDKMLDNPAAFMNVIPQSGKHNGMSALFLLLDAKQPQLAMKLLSQPELSPDVINSIPQNDCRDGDSVIRIAIARKYTEVVAQIISRVTPASASSIPKQGPNQGTSALWSATAHKNWELAVELLERSDAAAINAIAEYGASKGISVLWLAAVGTPAEDQNSAQHKDFINRLIARSSKESINAVAKDGKFKGTSVLWWVIYYKDWELAAELLKRSDAAAINAIAEDGFYKGISVLWLAAFAIPAQDQDNLVKQRALLNSLIAQSNADAINAVATGVKYKGTSVLWWATARKSWELAAELLKRSNETAINAIAEDGSIKGISVLWLAIERLQWDFVYKLLEKLESHNEAKKNCNVIAIIQALLLFPDRIKKQIVAEVVSQRRFYLRNVAEIISKNLGSIANDEELLNICLKLRDSGVNVIEALKDYRNTEVIRALLLFSTDIIEQIVKDRERTCSISLFFMLNPVTLPDGNRYSQDGVRALINNNLHNTAPLKCPKNPNIQMGRTVPEVDLQAKIDIANWVLEQGERLNAGEESMLEQGEKLYLWKRPSEYNLENDLHLAQKRRCYRYN